MLATLESHWAVWAVPAFTILSLLLTFIASALTALGDKVPGWLGDAIGVAGKILHFLNGNTAAATAPAASTTPPAS